MPEMTAEEAVEGILRMGMTQADEIADTAKSVLIEADGSKAHLLRFIDRALRDADLSEEALRRLVVVLLTERTLKLVGA